MAAKVPKKYTKGLGESTQARRKAEIRKRIKGKKSFKPLPGDARAKTKESKYTKLITKVVRTSVMAVGMFPFI